MARLTGLHPNLSAFLDTIAFSEGTINLSDEGYSCLFGGGSFASYADHPRVAIQTKWGWTDAAGRYQIMAQVPGKIQTNTFEWVSAACKTKDFSPETQDKLASYLVKWRGALDDIIAGRFTSAVLKCNKEWASLCGAPYGQPTKSMAALSVAYRAYGGTIS